MTDLLIFGDSFGEENMIAYPSGHPMHSEYKKLTSYHDMIRASGLFKSVTTYALGGSDLWSQYKLLLEHYKSGATVLWFETHPGRLVSRCGINLANYNSVLHRLEEHTSGYYKNTNGSEHIINVLTAAKSYFEYLQRDDYDRFVHNEIIDDIKKHCERVIFIPCFTACATVDSNSSHLGLCYAQEQTVFGKISGEYWDIRRNHMIEENHKILANELIEHFKTGKPISYDKFVLPKQDDVDKYFRKIS